MDREPEVDRTVNTEVRPLQYKLFMESHFLSPHKCGHSLTHSLPLCRTLKGKSPGR